MRDTGRRKYGEMTRVEGQDFHGFMKDQVASFTCAEEASDEVETEAVNEVSAIAMALADRLRTQVDRRGGKRCAWDGLLEGGVVLLQCSQACLVFVPMLREPGFESA